MWAWTYPRYLRRFNFTFTWVTQNRVVSKVLKPFQKNSHPYDLSWIKKCPSAPLTCCTTDSKNEYVFIQSSQPKVVNWNLHLYTSLYSPSYKISFSPNFGAWHIWQTSRDHDGLNQHLTHHFLKKFLAFLYQTTRMAWIFIGVNIERFFRRFKNTLTPTWFSSSLYLFITSTCAVKS